MPIRNSDIARIFNHLADLLEIREANPFRVRAYRNAARTITDQPQSMAAMLEEGKDLSQLPGIGEDLAGKIADIVETGTLKMLQELEEEVPSDLSELLKISGLGPKRVAALHHELGIETLDELAEAAEKKKIRELEGFGEKTEQKFLKEVKRRVKADFRTKLAEAEQVAG
ncbi:MAG: DNA polymerase III, partial [Deltaproteobacteria bacterium]|nr:DNA polymerase III [Candidatus Anaeroferrophillacea bacterium]